MTTNKSPLNESFSRAMNYYKTLRGKSNKEIAEALSLPPTTVSAWNTGRHLPDMDRLQRLATYLEAPLDQFFDFSLDKLPDNELSAIYAKIDTDSELVRFLKVFFQLSAEEKHLLTLLAIKFIS